MKNGKGTFQERLKTTSVVLSLVFTVGGVAVSLFNYYTLNQLQPLYTYIKEVKAEGDKTKEDLASYKESQIKFLETLATKDQVKGIEGRLNDIRFGLNQIIEIVAKK